MDRIWEMWQTMTARQKEILADRICRRASDCEHCIFNRGDECFQAVIVGNIYKLEPNQ